MSVSATPHPPSSLLWLSWVVIWMSPQRLGHA